MLQKLQRTAINILQIEMRLKGEPIIWPPTFLIEQIRLDYSLKLLSDAGQTCIY